MASRRTFPGTAAVWWSEALIATHPLTAAPSQESLYKFQCGHCWLGCDSGSKFVSLRVLVQTAALTGKLTLMPNSRVRSIELDKDGREVKAKVFVLGAGCIETEQTLRVWITIR